jgi:hypothetical protein
MMTKKPPYRLLPERLRGPTVKPTVHSGEILPPAVERPLREDILYGVEAIQAEMNFPTAKHVYRMREKTDCPIFIMPGVGIAARKTALIEWVLRIECEDIAARRLSAHPAR